MKAESEVKGVWFVTARAYLVEHHGESVADEVAQRMSPAHRAALATPLASEWYPELALAEALAAMREVVARGRAAEFARLLDACTTLGIGRFFRVMLGLTSTTFVLRQVPTMWGQIRRGAGQVSVEQSDDSTLVRYAEFPWFKEDDYIVLTLESLRALTRVAARREPHVSLVERRRDALTVEIRHR